MTLSRNNLPTCFVPNCNRVHGANVAGAQQPLAGYLLGGHEYRGSSVVEDEGLGGFRHAVAESHAQRSIDAHAQAPDDALFEVAHIPSNPSSARAVSITAGVISPMPRSL